MSKTKHRRRVAPASGDTLIDAIPQLVWVRRSDGLLEYTNQRWCDYTGLTPEQIQSDRRPLLAIIHPDDQEGHRARRQHALDTGTMFENEERLKQCQTGEYRWFLTRALPVRNETGQILKWLGTCTDIEDQKRAEQQFKASEEHWRVLAETVPQLVWTTSPDGWVEYWNQRWYNYTGSTPKQALGHEWNQFVHPDDYQYTLTVWHQALEMGDPYEIEYRLKEGQTQTGAYRWFLVRGTPVRNEAGQIIKWFGTCTDIDERKRIEEALRQSQERADALMKSNIIGIFVSEGGQILDANDTFLRMTGYIRENLRAGHLNVLQMTVPEDLARTQRAYQELVH